MRLAHQRRDEREVVDGIIVNRVAKSLQQQALALHRHLHARRILEHAKELAHRDAARV